MPLRDFFRKTVKSFDDLREMVTRDLPIPGFEGTDKYIRFAAHRDSEGYWSITTKTNITTVTVGVETVTQAYQAAMLKHTGKVPGRGQVFKMNFDTVFLILRDMEEALLKYRDNVAKQEPPRHYMSAYRLLPDRLRTDIDDLYFLRNREKGQILKPRPPGPAAPPEGAKPN